MSGKRLRGRPKNPCRDEVRFHETERNGLKRLAACGGAAGEAATSRTGGGDGEPGVETADAFGGPMPVFQSMVLAVYVGLARLRHLRY
jgi:hypothetical protein